MRLSRPEYLSFRGFQFRSTWRSVMPEHRMLHEGDTLPLHGMRQYAGRLAWHGRHAQERGQKGIVIVPIHFDQSPVERTPFGGERFQSKSLAYGTQALNLVVIDDCQQIVQP